VLEMILKLLSGFFCYFRYNYKEGVYFHFFHSEYFVSSGTSVGLSK